MYLSDATALRNKEDAQADLRYRINEDRKAVIAATKKQYPQIGILVSETTKFYAYINGVYTESRFINAIVRKIEAAKSANEFSALTIGVKNTLSLFGLPHTADGVEQYKLIVRSNSD
jgi:hypothetical protein